MRVAWTCAVVVLLAGPPAGVAQTARPTQDQHPRLFPPQDLGLLEAPDRDEWQRPQQILDALGVADASVGAPAERVNKLSGPSSNRECHRGS